MPKRWRPRGVTPRPRSGAAAESARLQRCRNGSKELPCIRGQGRQRRVPGCYSAGAVERSYPPARGQGGRPGGATPGPRSGDCVGAGGPRGAIPRSRSGGVVLRRHPLSKVRSSSSACWSSREEIPHTQGKRNPSKRVGVARGH